MKLKVNEYSPITGELIRTFSSMKDAAREFSCSEKTISRNINSKNGVLVIASPNKSIDLDLTDKLLVNGKEVVDDVLMAYKNHATRNDLPLVMKCSIDATYSTRRAFVMHSLITKYMHGIYGYDDQIISIANGYAVGIRAVDRDFVQYMDMVFKRLRKNYI